MNETIKLYEIMTAVEIDLARGLTGRRVADATEYHALVHEVIEHTLARLGVDEAFDVNVWTVDLNVWNLSGYLPEPLFAYTKDIGQDKRTDRMRGTIRQPKLHIEDRPSSTANTPADYINPDMTIPEAIKATKRAHHARSIRLLSEQIERTEKELKQWKRRREEAEKALRDIEEEG